MSSTMSTFSDFILNKIPYAEETTKLSDQRLPEYARGYEIPDYDNGGVDRSWNGLTGRDEPYRILYEAPSKPIDLDDEYRSSYNQYQTVKGTGLDKILDYEQYLENQVRDRNKKNAYNNLKVEHYKQNPLSIFSAMYDSLRQKLVGQNY